MDGGYFVPLPEVEQLRRSTSGLSSPSGRATRYLSVEPLRPLLVEPSKLSFL